MAKRRIRGGIPTAVDGDETTVQVEFTSQRQTVLNSLLARTADLDPVLLGILQELVDEMNRIAVIVDPAPVQTGKPPDAGTGGKPSIPTDFRYTINLDNIFLQWTLTSADYAFYEIRKGTDWNTADRILVTNNASAVLEPLLYGTHTYLLKALSTLGIYSNETLRIDIFIPNIGGISILPLVAANSVTLNWNIPTSVFRIDHYDISKDGTFLTTAAGTFFAFSEQIGGSHTFGVTPVDVAGNRGAESTVSVVTTGITDYIFFAKLVSNLNGILINGVRDSGAIYVCVNHTETIQQHFDNHGWISPKAQIDAGYPLWLSPFLTTASYEETFDFGVVIHSAIVSISWIYQVLHGSFTFGWEIQTSQDGITWSPIQSSPQFYATEIRYIKVKINFTGADDLSLLQFRELAVSLNVKRENDGGFGTALASDVNGTAVNFIKQFVDVESITVTPVSTTATFSTYEFNDVPFPTYFLVSVYDNAGVRITRDFRWAARGII
jgi:hypothetical protein